MNYIKTLMLFTLCDRANGLWPRGGHVRPQADYRNATLFWDTLSMSAWREDSSFTSLHYWPLMLTNINPALKSYGTLLYWEILCVVSKYFKLFVTSGEAVSLYMSGKITIWLCDWHCVIKAVFMYFFYSKISSSTFFVTPTSEMNLTPSWHLLFMPWLPCLESWFNRWIYY